MKRLALIAALIFGPFPSGVDAQEARARSGEPLQLAVLQRADTVPVGRADRAILAAERTAGVCAA